MEFFKPTDRSLLQETVLAWAGEDDRVVAGALIGSLAAGTSDAWSDLDLTFGLASGTSVKAMLDEWTPRLAETFGARRLLDLSVGQTVYRVHLLPQGLQFDLSFSPIETFGARGPKFRLLFGDAAELPTSIAVNPEHLLGLAAHHVLRARICVERGRFWQAEYWTSLVRDHALDLACLRRDLPAHHGRGYDDLPNEDLQALNMALVRSLDAKEILRALSASVEGLLRHAGTASEMAMGIESDLRALVS